MNEWLKKIAAFFKGNPNATEEEAIKSVGEPPAPTTTGQQQPVNLAGLSPEIAKLIEEMRAQIVAGNEQNKNLINALNEEKKAREESIKTTQAEQEKVRVQKRDEWLKKHTEAGRIAPQNEEDKKYWTELYDALGSDKAETAISKITTTLGETQKTQQQGAPTKSGVQNQATQTELMEKATSELSQLMTK